MSSPYRTRLQLTPKTKVKTQTRQRLVAGGSVLAVAILFGLGVFMYGNFGNSHEALAAISTNMGFENDLTNWTVTSGSWSANSTAANVRSGSKSMKLSSANTTAVRVYNSNCTIAAPASGTNYIAVTVYVQGSAATGRVKLGIYDQTANSESVQSTLTTISNGGYTLVTYSITATNGHTYYPVLYGQSTTGTLNMFYDDVMMYTSTSNTVDVTSPNAPTAVSATCSGTNITLSFTQGTDAQSGIDGVMILRQAGTQPNGITTNNQTTYSTTATVGPTTLGSYSVVYNGIAVSSFTDNPGSTGAYTYLIYMRDKNYNYTAAASAARIWVMNGTTLNYSVLTNSAIDGLYIPAGNTLTIGSSATIIINSGATVTVSGYLKQQGSITNNGTITFANGSTYEYNRNGSATAGTGIPTATWASGSLCYITGVTSTVPLGTGQTFYDFTWNCLSQTSSVILNTSFNCNRNLTITESGPGSSIRTVWLDGITHIKGNIHVTTLGNINFDYGSTVYLDGTTLQNIDNTGGYLWFENVIVDNSAGVKLLDAVLVDSVFTMRNGNININGMSWEFEDMAQVVRENGTLTGSFTPWGYYDLTYKNAVTTGSELSTYTDEVYRLKMDLTGTVTLGAHAYVNNSITFISGKLATGSYEVKLLSTSVSAISGYGSLSYIVGNLRRNVAATGAYIFPVGTTANYELMTITFAAQTGITSLLVYFNNTAPGTVSGVTVNGIVVGNMLNYGFWTCTPNSAMTGGTYTATGLLKGYTNTGLNANTKYYMLKRPNSSGAWASLGTQNLTNGQTVGDPIIFSSIGLSSFSDFGAGYGGGSTLPITLSSFSVNLVDNKYADLNWTTSAELNNAYFDIERSADGKNYDAIGRVDGHGTSLVMNEYNFKDESPLEGISYYRLKQTDFDGPFTYSPIQSLNNAQIVLTADDVNLFPNPATTEINVAVQMKKEGDQQIEIVDLAGRVVYSQSQSFYEGQNQFKLPLDNLPTGFYFVKFGAEGETPVLKKFLKN